MYLNTIAYLNTVASYNSETHQYHVRAGYKWTDPDDPQNTGVHPDKEGGYAWANPTNPRDYRLIAPDGLLVDYSAEGAQAVAAASRSNTGASSGSVATNTNDSGSGGMSDQDRQNVTDLAVIGGAVALGVATKTDTSPILRQYADQRLGIRPTPIPARAAQWPYGRVSASPAPQTANNPSAAPTPDVAKQAEIKRRLGDL